MRSSPCDNSPEIPTCIYCNAPTDTDICAACEQAIRDTSATVPEERSVAMSQHSLPVCPEASFSLCLRGTIDGRDAQLTIRAQTWAQFHEHVTAARGLLDAGPAASPGTNACPGATGSGSSAGPSGGTSQPSTPVAPAEEARPLDQVQGRLCPLHGVPMRLQVNARGSWWSHRVGDGSWCKGR